MFESYDAYNSGACISDADAATLGAALRTNNTLTTLTLNGGYIGGRRG